MSLLYCVNAIVSLLGHNISKKVLSLKAAKVLNSHVYTKWTKMEQNFIKPFLNDNRPKYFLHSKIINEIRMM